MMSKPGSIKAPQMKSSKFSRLNSQNLIMLGIFIVGCYILYRMISSVQQQVLLLKNEMVNMRLENSRTELEIVPKGFEASEQDVDETSVKSLDIDAIMTKLNSSPLEGSIKRRTLYSTMTSNGDDITLAENVEENKDDHESQGKAWPDEEVATETNESTNNKKTISIDEDDISKFPIGKLRKILKEKGESGKGTKAELIDRLQSITSP